MIRHRHWQVEAWSRVAAHLAERSFSCRANTIIIGAGIRAGMAGRRTPKPANLLIRQPLTTSGQVGVDPHGEVNVVLSATPKTLDFLLATRTGAV